MDVLAALEHLEEAEAEKRRNERKANPKKRYRTDLHGLSIKSTS
jgi:hypothetical protein